MSFEAYPMHERLAARCATSAGASSSGTSRKSTSGSYGSRTILSRQQLNQGDIPLVVLGPWSGTDDEDDGEWSGFLPARKASDSTSPAGCQQGFVQRASTAQVPGRWFRQRGPPYFYDMAERGDVDDNVESPPDEKADENAEGEDAGGVASEGEQLLSASKDDLGSSEAAQGVVEKSSEAAAGLRDKGDVFERLRHARHVEAQPNEIVFSVQQENDRWLVVFLVAGLYVFFYAIGGLAYYLLDEYGYTVAYSGRTNLSNTEEPFNARRH